MRKILVLLAFITVSFIGQCDTLDYYHVFLNDSLIGRYNALSEKPSIVLKQSELKEDDILTVRYGTDHPCVECVYVLTVLIEVKQKMPEAETTENFGKLSIPISDLLYFRDEIDTYHFNYHVRTGNPMLDSGTYLFELKLL